METTCAGSAERNGKVSTLTDWEKRQGEPPLLLQGKTGARGRVSSTPHIQMSMARDAGDNIIWPDPAEFTEEENAKLLIMRDEGIVNPLWTLQVCKAFDVPLPMELAYLVIESYGGKNIWHNDDTWMIGESLRSVGEETVREATYNVYTVYRSRFGYQGVGPNGLTAKWWQDRGDFYGGTWHPRSNMAGAVSYFKERLDAGDTPDDISHAYNPGSSGYVDRHKEQRKWWRQRLAQWND